MRTALLFIIATIVVGCSPEKRLNRLLMKHPELRDTIWAEAVVEYIKGDTVFRDRNVGDTVTLTKDRLTVRYVRMPGDTVWLGGECASDTVRIAVPVVQPTKTVERLPWWVAPVLLAMAVVMVILALRR